VIPVKPWLPDAKQYMHLGEMSSCSDSILWLEFAA